MKLIIYNIKFFLGIFSYVLCDLFAHYDGTLRKWARTLFYKNKHLTPHQEYDERINIMLSCNSSLSPLWLMTFGGPLAMLLTIITCMFLPFIRFVLFFFWEGLWILLVLKFMPNRVNGQEHYFREMDKKEGPHIWKWRLLMLLAIVLDIALGIFCLHLISP